jgi:hypothetical protein
MAAIASAMIPGGFLFERHPRLTLLLSSFFVLLAGLCVLFVAEKKEMFRPRGLGRGSVFGDSLRRLGRAVRETAAAPGLTAFVLIGAALASLLRRQLSLFRTGRLLAWMLGSGLALLLGTLSASAWAVLSMAAVAVYALFSARRTTA